MLKVISLLLNAVALSALFQEQWMRYYLEGDLLSQALWFFLFLLLAGWFFSNLLQLRRK